VSIQELEATNLKHLYESNIVGILISDIYGNIEEANDFFLSLIGYSRNELPLSWEALTPLEWRDLDRAKITEVVTTGEGVPWEKEYLGKDGQRVPILVGVALLAGNSGQCIGIVVDVTKRKQAEQQLIEREEQLQALAIALLQAEERERRRIAQGLHDHIGQILALAKGKLSTLQDAARAGGIEQAVEEIQNLINQAIHTSRSRMFDLSSPVLYELGLDAALQSLGEQLAQQHGFRLHFRTNEKPKPLTGDVDLMLYRVARELLFNVVKHALARNVSLAVVHMKDHLHLTLADDGVGFDAAGAGEGFDERGGFGLFSIRQQLDHIGGSLEIDSVPGDGTQVSVVVPLA
jgi:PAS domain S-box-containing protein